MQEYRHSSGIWYCEKNCPLRFNIWPTRSQINTYYYCCYYYFLLLLYTRCLQLYTKPCGNKMSTRCNRWFFYCRSYCLLNMFRAPLCPSSGALECYTGGCCLWYLVLWFSSCWYGVELRVMCPVCGLLLYFEVGILFPHINDDARSKSLQILI